MLCQLINDFVRIFEREDIRTHSSS
jgi:hypothetical protein